MNDPIDKTEIGSICIQDISDFNIDNAITDHTIKAEPPEHVWDTVWIENKDGVKIEPGDIYYGEVFPNPVNEDVEVKQENIKLETKMNKKPMDVTSKAYAKKIPYQCSHCDKAFGINSDLKTHLRTHTGEKKLEYRCRENNCREPNFRTLSDIRNHLKLFHNLNHHEIVKEFDSEQKFMSWKNQYEHDELVNLSSNNVRTNTTKSGVTIKTTYHNCSRNGLEQSTPKRFREKKKKSIKLNDFCTCALTVIRSDNTKQIIVKLYPTHYNHLLDRAHKMCLSLSKKDESDIAQRFEHGVKGPQIKSDICEPLPSLNENEIRPIHLINRQKLQHIKNKTVQVDGRLDSEDIKIVS